MIKNCRYVASAGAMALVSGTLLSACAVGPRYARPGVPVPPAYKEQAVAIPSELQLANPIDQVSRGAWWQLYGDARLNGLEERLLKSNPTFAEAEARFRQAQAVVRQNRAAYFPVIDSTTSAVRTRPGSVSGRSTAPGTATEYDQTVSLSWEADLWERIRNTVGTARASAQSAAADVEATRLSLTAELAVDYFTLRSLDSELALFDQTIEAYQRAATLTHNQYTAGIVSRSDVEQADAQLASAQAQAIDVRLQRVQLEHAIAVLLGEPPAAFSLEATTLDGEPPVIPADLPSRLLERRPDVASSERLVAAANAQVGVASAAFFPAVTLGASGGFQGTRLQQWLSWPMRYWSVGPALALTVFDAGARRAAKAAAVASYDQAVATYRQTVLTAFQDVEDNLAAERLLADEAKRQDEAVAAARRSVDISLNQYRAGTVSYLQVATQQTILLTNQRAAVTLTGQRFAVSVGLVRALGGGWNGDLAAAKGGGE